MENKSAYKFSLICFICGKIDNKALVFMHMWYYFINLLHFCLISEKTDN